MRLLLALVVTGALVACSDDGGGEEGSVAKLCAAIGDGEAFAQVFDGFDPTDTERALEQLRTARVRLGELHDAAPDEVRPALSTEIDYVQALLDALEAVPPDDPSAAVAAVNGLDEQRAAVDVASGELEAFETASCPGATTAPP